MLTKQDVAFRHYRKIDADGTVNPRGGATLAFPKGQLYMSMVAYCSPKDNFIYSHGRSLAMSRLNELIASGYEPNGSVNIALADYYFSSTMGYTHITRSKNRRKSKDEA